MSISPPKRFTARHAALLAAAALLCAMAPPAAQAGFSSRAARGHEKKDPIPLEQSQIFIEFNATDNDLGFHVKLDGEDWRYMKIVNPDGRTVYEARGKSAFGELGLTELFFEGAEPSLDEFPLDELLALFPEGDYQFIGKSVDGEDMTGAGTLSHLYPDAPVVTAVMGQTVDPANAVVAWQGVTTPPGVNIVEYEIIVDESSLRVPGSQTSIRIPPEMLQPGRTYELEVLAVDANHNQTITAGFFSTTP